MSPTWLGFADNMLKHLAQRYPGVDNFNALLKLDTHWQDNRAAIQEGFDFLVSNKLIADAKLQNYMCTTEGREVAKSGVAEFVKKLDAKKEKENIKEDLTLKLLQQQIIEIKRKNKYWWLAAVAGVLAFIYNLLQLFKII